MTKLRKITWSENHLTDGSTYIMGVIRPDEDVYNSTKIGSVTVYKDGTIRTQSDLLKGYSIYKTSVGRTSIEEAKKFLNKTFLDYMKLLLEGEVVLHDDDTPESDDYVPSNWFSGDAKFDKEFTKKARKFKEDMKSDDIEVLKTAAKQWKEDTQDDKFPKHPYGHVLHRVAKECAEEWWVECYHNIKIKDTNEVVCYTYHYD